MTTLARSETMVACQPAAAELVPITAVPYQRDGGFLFDSPMEYDTPTHLVPGLGKITLQHSRLVQLANDAAPRLRRTLDVQLDCVTHSTRITEPEAEYRARTQPLDTIVMLHGYTEMIDAGTGKNLHDALAPHFPDQRLISIATDGVGRYCQRVGWKEGLSKDFTKMAIDRHRLVNVLKGSGRITLLDVSMGSVIGIELLAYNTQLKTGQLSEQATDPWLDIAAVIHHSSAQVPPGRVIPDMVMRFLPHIYRDTRRVSTTMSRPAQGIVQTAIAYPRSLPALAGNLVQLLRGTNPEKVLATALAYPTGYISGQHDPLAQNDDRLRMAQRHPGQVITYVKPGAGHADCLDAQAAANDIANMHQLLATL